MEDSNSFRRPSSASPSISELPSSTSPSTPGDEPLDLYPDVNELGHLGDSSSTVQTFLGRFSFERPASLRARSSKETLSISLVSEDDLENQTRQPDRLTLNQNFRYYCDAVNQTEEIIFLDEKARVEEVSAPDGTNPEDFPDGGLEAWLVVLGGWCCLFTSFGWINCIGIFQAYYETNQLANLSPSTIAWIPSLETFMMFFGGSVFGLLFDNYGPRYLLLIGSLAHVFGLMMTSISTQYFHFILAQGIISALGASAIFYAAMSSVGTWFFKNRAASYGIMASGSSLGGVVLPIMVMKLEDRLGFAWTMRSTAFMFLGLLIIANLTVKSRLTPKPKKVELKEFIVPLKEPPFALLTIGSFMFFSGLFLPFNYIIVQAQTSGMSRDLSVYLVSILNAASIFGRVIPGFVADRFGRFNTLIATCMASAILVLGLWIPSKNNATLITFSALYGFASGAYVSLVPSLVAQISDIRQLGVRSGALFAIISVAALTGNPIGGNLVSKDNGGFIYLQIFCGVVMTLGSIGFIASRAVQVGFKLVKI